MLAREERQRQARRKEPRGKDRSGLGQSVSGAPARHEAPAAANPERSPFGALQQDDANERYGNHDVNQQKDSAHLVALVFEGAVLSESATVWLGLLSAVVLGSRVGLRSGSGMSSV